MKKLILLFFFSSLLLGISVTSFASEAATAEATTTAEENTAHEDQDLFKTPTGTPTRSRAASEEDPLDPPQTFTHITPEKPSRTRRESLTRHKPLTEEQLDTLIEYHNKNYPYQLIHSDFYPSADDLFATLKYFLVEEGKEDSHVDDFMFFGNEEPHWGAVYINKKEDKLNVVFLDSLGLEGGALYLTNLLKQLVTDLSRDSKVQALTLEHVTFYAIAIPRQKDSFSCGLYSLNDLRALSLIASNYKKGRGPSPMEIFEAEATRQNTHPEPLLVSGSDSGLKLTVLKKLPVQFFTATQYPDTLGLLDLGPIDSPQHPHHFLGSIPKGKEEKEVNLFSEIQWKQVEEILRKAQEETGSDSDEESF